MADIIEGIKPTRMELLAIRKRLALTVKGHKLLSEKRDALVNEFFKIIKSRGETRGRVESLLNEAYESLYKAEMLMNSEQIAAIAESTPAMKSITMDTKNIMGVLVPLLETLPDLSREPTYSFYFTNAALDLAIEKFRGCMEELLQLAEIEGAIEQLAGDIVKTKRRVNALEYIFMPQLKATAKYITMQLQEREREDFFRRKRIKALLEGSDAMERSEAS